MVWIFVITIILMFIGCNLILDEPFTQIKNFLFMVLIDFHQTTILLLKIAISIHLICINSWYLILLYLSLCSHVFWNTLYSSFIPYSHSFLQTFFLFFTLLKLTIFIFYFHFYCDTLYFMYRRTWSIYCDTLCFMCTGVREVCDERWKDAGCSTNRRYWFRYSIQSQFLFNFPSFDLYRIYITHPNFSPPFPGKFPQMVKSIYLSSLTKPEPKLFCRIRC